MGVGAAIAAGVSAVAGISSTVKGLEMLEDAESEYEAGMQLLSRNVELAEEFKDRLKELGEQGIEYAQSLLDNWEETFGPIEDSLAEYYNTLDPQKYATQWKTYLADATQKQLNQLNEQFAQPGLMTSGMKMQLEKEAAFKQAQGNAMIDLTAPERVMQQKNQFYGAYGAPQKARYEGMYTNAINNMANMESMGFNALSNAQTNLGGAFMDKGNMIAQQAQGMLGAGGSMLGSAINLGINAFSPAPSPLLGGGKSSGFGKG